MSTALVPKAPSAGQIVVESADETLLVEIGRPGPDAFMVLGYAIFGPIQIGALAWLWYAVSHNDAPLAWALVANVAASLATWRWTAQTFNRTTIHINRQCGFVAYRPFGFRWTFTTARVAATIGTRHDDGYDYPVIELSFDRKNMVLEMPGHTIETLRWLCDIFNLWMRRELDGGCYRR